MSVPDCPSREELFDYAVGRLSDEASDVLSAHLEACSTCQTMLATVNDTSDSLVARLRLPVADDPLLAEPECGVALARAKAVAGRQAATSGGPAQRRTGPLSVPGQLGEYELLEELGHGGMGTVYKALHTKLDRVVALKVLAKGRVEDRARHRTLRARDESHRPAGSPADRACPRRPGNRRPSAADHGIHRGAGPGRLVERVGRLRAAEACELARQVAVGLEYVRGHGLVHRDIKPSNLMLTPRGEVKILDLGLARLHRERGGSDEMTGTGQTMGTADYMAPEQASDSHAADIRADIYSLGCTLFKLLSGRAPFEGPDYRGTFDKMTAHVQTPAPSIRELADVPEELAALLGRMLAKDPGQRPATPAEVAAALAPFCTGHDLPALLNGRIGFQPVIGRLEAYPTPPSGMPSRSPKGFQSVIGRLEAYPTARRRLMLLLGLTVVLGLAGAFLLHIRHKETDTSLDVPEGSDVRISKDGGVDVTLPDEAAKDQPNPAAAVQPDERAIQGTWKVETIQGTWEGVDWSTAATTGSGYSPLLAVYAMFLRGQTLTIGRQTLGPEGQEGPDSTAPPLGMGGMGAGSIGMGGMGAMNPWMNGMNFGKAWRYALNPATRPKSIDFLSTPGGTLLGIYDLSGDRLTMCLGPQRPKGLAIGPEDKTALVVLQRVTGSGRQGNPRSWPAVESLASPADQRKPPRPLAVNVDRDGTAAIAGMPIEDDRLQTLVGLLLGDNPRRQVCLRCDADLPFSRAVDLLAVLKAAGMPRSSVLLATAPTPAARLDFRIAAIPGKDGDKSSITAAENQALSGRPPDPRADIRTGRAGAGPAHRPAKRPCGPDRVAGRDREG